MQSSHAVLVYLFPLVNHSHVCQANSCHFQLTEAFTGTKRGLSPHQNTPHSFCSSKPLLVHLTLSSSPWAEYNSFFMAIAIVLSANCSSVIKSKSTSKAEKSLQYQIFIIKHYYIVNTDALMYKQHLSVAAG